MASDLDIARAVVDALADENVTGQEFRDVLEEYIDNVGNNASLPAMASIFVAQLRRHIRTKVGSGAGERKKGQIRKDIVTAINDAKGKLPPKLR